MRRVGRLEPQPGKLEDVRKHRAFVVILVHVSSIIHHTTDVQMVFSYGSEVWFQIWDHLELALSLSFIQRESKCSDDSVLNGKYKIRACKTHL